MGRIIWSRLRLRFARALLNVGRNIVEAEESRWGVATLAKTMRQRSRPAASGRVPSINPKCGARRR